MTYALLNLPFLLAAAVLLAAVRVRTGRPDLRAVALTGVVMLVLTAVFDNLMIRAGLVAYDDAQRLGPSIGVAPVEDFAYTVLAVLALPALWCALGARRSRDRSGPGDGPAARRDPRHRPGRPEESSGRIAP